MSVDLRHLRSFVMVAQEGHIGRAAQLMAGQGWEEVAQYIADWLERVLRPAPVATDWPGA